MARAVQLPRPLPGGKKENAPARAPSARRAVEKPTRDHDLVPDRVMRALVKELEETTRREPEPVPLPNPDRARYRYD